MTGYLSKSDFQVASACPTKLFYRKQGYPCTNGQNDYLEFLADGGYMENGECLVNLLVRQGKAGMADIEDADLCNAHGEVGPDHERRRLQRHYILANQEYRSPELSGLVTGWRYPLHPRMKGRLSIKQVLPAVWESNPRLHAHPAFARYYGRDEDGQLLEPYLTLPPLRLGDDLAPLGGAGFHATRSTRARCARATAPPAGCAVTQKTLRPYERRRSRWPRFFSLSPSATLPKFRASLHLTVFH